MEIAPHSVRLRTRWLIATLIGYFLFPLCNAVLAIFPAAAMNSTVVIATAVQASIGFYIAFHCAYRKFGTKWLIFMLIMQPIQFLRELAQFGAEEFSPFSWGVLLLMVTMYACWYPLSIKMLMLNRTIRQGALSIS